MKNYLLVLKLLLKNMFRRGGENKAKYMWIAYGILALTGLMFAAFLGAGIYFIAPYFSDPSVLVSYLFVISFFVVIFFSLLSMLAYLYFAKDTEFFLSLPIKPSVIYFAKLTMVYLVELLVALFVLVPSMLMIGFSLSLGAVYFITMFFAVILIPFFPLVFTSIIAIPLMYVVSFLKNKTAVGSAVAILLFAGLMAGYMLFTINLQTGMTEQSEESFLAMVQTLENAFPIWGKIFYPFLCLARFALMQPNFGSVGISMLINILIFVLSGAALFFLSVLVSNLVYRRGAAKNLENSATKNAKGTNVKRSITKSLVMLEWKEIYRNPTFAFQCLSFVLLCPVITFVLLFMYKQTGAESEIGSEAIWLTACGIMSFFGLSTNIAAQTAITRLGKAFYYTKIIPVDYRAQIKAKLVLYSILSFVPALLGSIIALIFSPIWYLALLMMLYLVTLGFAGICFSVWFDLKNPKLNWVTYTEAVKQNKNVTINTLINMGVAMLLMGVLAIIFAILSSMINPIAALAIAFVVMTGLMAALSVVLYNVLFSRVDKYFVRID